MKEKIEQIKVNEEQIMSTQIKTDDETKRTGLI